MKRVLGWSFGGLNKKQYLCTYVLSLKETPGIAAALIRIVLTTIMNWIVLIIAGLCECGFTFCLGEAKTKDGVDHLLWLGGFVLFTIFSMALLAKAAHSIPLGTAYPVWTGIGAVGTVVLGILVFHESATFWRVFFITTLILSVIGLKIVSA